MAYRVTPLVNGEIYHIFNRSIARQPIFTQTKEFQRFIEVIDFYRFKNPPARFSHYNRLTSEQKRIMLDSLYGSGSDLVEIYVYSLMNNHFHLLVKQIKDNGIKLLISQIQNSYAKYFNTRNDRTGSLFQEMFKAVRIETDEQLIHVARYIHINPVTSFEIKNMEELAQYPWTSFVDYMGRRELALLTKGVIMNHFIDKEELKQFTMDQIDYQRTIEKIKHLLFL